MPVAMSQDIMQKAAHAAQSNVAHRLKELLLKKADLEGQCLAAFGRAVNSVCISEVEAAHHELRHIAQQGDEVCSQLKALQGDDSSSSFYIDKYGVLDQELQQLQEQHADPTLILRTTKQREMTLHHLCTDIMFRTFIKFEVLHQKAEATKARLSELAHSVVQLQQRQRLELGRQLAAPDVESLEELKGRLADRQKVRGCAY